MEDRILGRPKGIKHGETKNKVLQYIKEHPGCVIKDLAVHTQRTEVRVMAIIQELEEKTNQIKVQIALGGRKYLFAKDYEGEMLEKIPEKGGRNRTIEILELIKSQPGITMHEVASITKIHYQNLHFVLKTLKDLNYLEVKCDPDNRKRNKYYIGEKQ